MRVSIAMATFNGAKYLKGQLDSFLNQRRQPDEVVVCDDGSTDETLEILAEFAELAPFDVALHRNDTNLGFVKNFEKALALCSGDVVFFSDQDDVWHPDKLHEVVRLFDLRPEMMVVVNNQYVTDAGLNSTAYTSLGNIRNVGVSESWFVSGCCMSIRQEFLPVVLPIPEEALGHDAWISKLADALTVRHVVETPLQHHRRHGENTSNPFVHRLGGVSLLSLITKYGLRDAREAWQRDLDHVERYRRRLLERGKELESLGLRAAKQRGVQMLSQQASALRARIELGSISRIRRFPRLVRSWRKGDYRQFYGWKSALKDILRP